MQNSEKQSNFDEINLADYVKVIFKRWKLVFLIFVLAILAGFIFSVLSPKIYLVDTTLDLAQTGEDLIENPSQLIEKIHNGVYNGKYHVRIIAENPKDTQLIKMRVKTPDIEKGKNALEEVSAVILAEHQSIIDIQKESIQSDIEKLENEIKLLEQDIKSSQQKISFVNSSISKTENKKQPIENDIERMKSKISHAKQEQKNLEDKVAALEQVAVYDQTPGTQFALFDIKEKLAAKKQEIEDLYLSINSLERSLDDLGIQVNSLESDKQDYNMRISALKADQDDLSLQINNLGKSLGRIQSTKIIKPITISSAPIKPRPMLNTAIAGVLGLFIGVFLAFGREWWKNSM